MLMLLLAETSRKGMPSSSASAWPRSVDTARFSSQSHLLPIRILFTPSVACCSTLENQVRMSTSRVSCVINFAGSELGWASNQPEVRTVEGSLVRHIVYQQDAHGASVVGRCDGAEPLLARRIPDLQLRPLAIQLDGPELKVDADRGDEAGRERVFAKAQQAA